MSAVFKRLERKDAFISPYTAHKTFTFASSSFGEVGIEWKRGVSGSFPYNEEALTYVGIKHIMFDTYGQTSTEYDWVSSLGTEVNVLSIPRELYGLSIKPGSFSLELPGDTTLTDDNGYILSGSNTVGYISYSKGLVAFTDRDYKAAGAFTGSVSSSIQTQNIDLKYQTLISDNLSYVDSTAFVTGVKGIITAGEFAVYYNDGTKLPSYGLLHNEDANGEEIESSIATWTNLIFQITDSYVPGNIPQDVIIANVIKNGIHWEIEIDNSTATATTDPISATIAETLQTTPQYTGSVAVQHVIPANYTASFQASEPILTHNYHCHIDPNEFNLSYNPSLRDTTKVSGSLLGLATGSEFRPYATGVGLYNSVGDLIAIGKLSEPTPILKDTHYTFVVKIDL